MGRGAVWGVIRRGLGVGVALAWLCGFAHPQEAQGFTTKTLEEQSGLSPPILIQGDNTSGTLTARERVALKFQVAQGPIDRIELSVDGVEALTLLAPRYEGLLETNTLSEAAHVLSARAVRGESRSPPLLFSLVVDRTSPQLQRQWPADGESVAAPVTAGLEFNEPLDPASVTSDCLRVRNEDTGQWLPVQLSLAESGTRLVATLQEDVTAGTRLAAVRGPGLTDRVGNPVKAAFGTWNFTLASAPVPSGQLPSSGASSNSRFVSVAMDARGWPVVASIEFYARKYSLPVLAWNGSGWTRLGAGPADQNRSGLPSTPVVAVDSLGRPVVAWTDTREGAGRDVFVSRWDGTQWTPLGESLSGYPGYTSAASPTLVLDGEGNPVVAWHEPRTATTDVSDVFVRRWSGTAWQPVGPALSGFEGNPMSDGSAAGPASIALDPAGQPVVAWQEFDPTESYSLIFVRRWDGTEWKSLGEPLSMEAYDVPTQPSVAVSAEGTVYVAWTESGYGTQSHVYVSRWEGEQWTAMAEPSAIGGDEQAIDISLVLDPKGVPLVTWDAWGSSAPNRIHVGRWAGSGWRLLPLSADATEGLVGGAVLAASKGGLFLGWLRRDDNGTTYNVFGQGLETSP